MFYINSVVFRTTVWGDEMVTLTDRRPQSFSPKTRPAAPITDDPSEFDHYADTGCEASDSCLDCPLPQCKYDDPAWYQRNRRLTRDFRIIHTMQQESLTIEETAQRFAVTPRTIFRIMQRCRQAAAQPAAAPLPLAA